MLDILIAMFLWHKALDWLCEMPLFVMQHRAVQKIGQDFERQCLDWYATRVSLESRERIDATKFHAQVAEMQGNVLKTLSFWLVWQIIQVISSFGTALFSFGLSYMWIIMGELLVIGLVTKFIYLPRRRKLLLLEEDRSRQKEKSRGFLSFLLPQFTLGNVTTDDILVQTETVESHRLAFNTALLSVTRIISLT